jgi:hypothetical protein
MYVWTVRIRGLNRLEITNKMWPCIRIHYSNVSYRLTCFEWHVAHHQELRLYLQPLVLHTSVVASSWQLNAFLTFALHGRRCTSLHFAWITSSSTLWTGGCVALYPIWMLLVQANSFRSCKSKTCRQLNTQFITLTDLSSSMDYLINLFSLWKVQAI